MAGVFNALFTRDSSKSFGYEIEGDTKATRTGIFCLKKAKKKGSGEEVSVFHANLTSLSVAESARAKNCLKRVKTLRHPAVIVYLESLETDAGLDIVTEAVQPLKCYLGSIENIANRDAVLASGILQIANAVLFLSRDAKLHHGRLSISSVYVNKCDEWKLFGFEHVFSGDSENDYGVSSADSKSPNIYRPRSITQRRSSGQAFLNSYGFGCFIWEVYNGELPSAEALKNRRSVPVVLANAYHQLVTGKMNMENFIDTGRKPQGYLNNKLTNALLFLDEFQLKTPTEQDHFLSNVQNNIDMFPTNVQVNKILPQLVRAVEFGCSGSSVLSVLLSIGKHLNDSQYASSLVPVILILFSSQNRSTRVKLLQELEHYVHHLKSDVVNDKVFPAIVTGFLDTNSTVREVTVKSIVHIAPRLNYNNLNVELMRHFARLLSKDEDGGIRTNTVICLGKIASYLHNDSRLKILMSAFTRAMADPFPPVRIAAILALSATQQFYSSEKIAKAVLPLLCCRTVDSEKQVREQAFRAIKGYLEKLEKYSEDPELAKQADAAISSPGSSILSSENVPQWASWALGALTKQFQKVVKPADMKKLAEEPAKSRVSAGATKSPNIAVAALVSGSKPDRDVTRHISPVRTKSPSPVSSVESNEEPSGWNDEAWESDAVQPPASDSTADDWNFHTEDQDFSSLDSPSETAQLPASGSTWEKGDRSWSKVATSDFDESAEWEDWQLSSNPQFRKPDIQNTPAKRRGPLKLEARKIQTSS